MAPGLPPGATVGNFPRLASAVIIVVVEDNLDHMLPSHSNALVFLQLIRPLDCLRHLLWYQA